MAITFPLSLPTSIGIESIELRAVNAVATSQSPFTFRQQIVAHQGQRWEASVSVASNIRRDLAAPWKAFLTALKGQQGTFLLGDPDYATARGKAGSSSAWFLEGGVWALGGEWDDNVSYDYAPSGTITANPVVSGNQTAGSDTLAVSGFTPSTSGVFLAGDYVQLGAGATAKLHQVLQDADSNGSGVVTLDIWPSLRSNINDGDTVTIDAPKGLFRLATNLSSWSINNSSAYGISFEAVEALAA